MAIITYPLDGIVYGASDVETYLCTRTSGVFDLDESFALNIIGGRSVSISSGQAWIKNANFTGKSVCSTAPQTLAFDLADSSLARIDRIVLRYDNVNRRSELAIVKGTSSANPQAPAITRNDNIYELGLYTVRFEAGTTTVTLSMITDTRGDASVCGRMGDGVSGLNDLQNQIDKMNRTGIVSLPASGWSSTAPYTQTVQYAYATGSAAEHPEWWLNGDPSEAQAEAFSYINSMKTNVGSLTFRAVAVKPTVDLQVMVKGI